MAGSRERRKTPNGPRRDRRYHLTEMGMPGINTRREPIIFVLAQLNFYPCVKFRQNNIIVQSAWQTFLYFVRYFCTFLCGYGHFECLVKVYCARPVNM
jgi:hypothetical protein